MANRSKTFLGAALVLAIGVPGPGGRLIHADPLQRISIGHAPVVGGAWGASVQVPSAGAITASGDGAVLSVSCPAAGSCLAGGQVVTTPGDEDPFIVEESNRTWGSAEVLPGISVLDAGGSSGSVNAVACWSVGNCEAIGTFADPTYGGSFVDREVAGSWGTPTAVPGTASIVEDTIQLDSLACTPYSCAAGGSYFDAEVATPRKQPLVLSESGGIWAPPMEVPGSIIRSDGGNSHLGGSQVNTISCGATNNCTAGGYYRDARAPSGFHAFLVSEVSGTWGSAIQVPGLGIYGAGAETQVSSISCASAGSCSAGGIGAGQPFLVGESKGKWGTSFQPMVHSIADPEFGAINSVSCATSGNCAAGGSSYDQSGTPLAFVVDEVDGRWQVPQLIPGAVKGAVLSVTCSAPGDCSAGGQFIADTSPPTAAMFANEVQGTWSPVIAVAGTQEISSEAAITVMSCSAPGDCGAGGGVYSRGGGSPPNGIVVTETPGPPATITSVTPDRGHARGGTSVVIRGRDLRDALAVDFGARAGLQFRVIGPSEVAVVSPRGTGSVNLQMITQTGRSELRADPHFTYTIPSVRRITPPEGSRRGGTLVTIYGLDFIGVSRVLFGDRRGLDLVFIDSDAIQIRDPNGTGTVVVRVTTLDGMSAASPNDRFTYKPT